MKANKKVITYIIRYKRIPFGIDNERVFANLEELKLMFRKYKNSKQETGISFYDIIPVKVTEETLNLEEDEKTN